MNPAQFLAHFDRISDAPDAIPRLRHFILDLPVRGKLVEQDPRDEPASELLKQIQAEKELLVKAGEIRKANPFPRIETDEIPFPSPVGWEWVRIRQVTSDHGQAVPNDDFTYIDVTAIDKEVGRLADAKVLSASDAPSRARKLVKTGDVLYSCVRPYLLNIAIIESDIVPSPIASTAFAVLNGFGLVLSKYLWIVLRSPFMVECVEGKMRGQAYPAINDSDFSLLPLPLPPLAEQHRIVAKVDELMALCDRLEAAQTERESRRDRLVASSLHRLNNGADPDAFRDHARFYFNHLPRLTTRREHIQQLRQAILNLAVRGKLVPQDPNDRPVRVIGRKEIPLSTDYDDHVFNESLSTLNLPYSWGIEPLARVVDAIVDCPHSTPKWADKGRICVRTNQFRPGYLDLSESRYVSEETYVDRIQRLEPTHDDILYSREGGILGVACRIPPDVKLCLGQRMMLIRVGEATTAQFLEMVLNSPFITTIARTRTTGGAAPRVNVATIKAYPIPLPPLAEQERIVAKVEEFMALCDRLEVQLTTTQTESRRLLDAVLYTALTSTA